MPELLREPLALERLRYRPETAQVIYYGRQRGPCGDASTARIFPALDFLAALRAYFIGERPAAEVAASFGYSVSAFHVLCHHFRRERDPIFFVTPQRGPRLQPKKSAARDFIIRLRKQNHSVYESNETNNYASTPINVYILLALQNR